MLKRLDSFNIYTISIVIISSLCLGITACQQGDDLLFNKLSPSRSGIEFTNTLQYSDSLSILEFEYMFNGSGVALIDINNDGLQDIYFGGNMASGKPETAHRPP